VRILLLAVQEARHEEQDVQVRMIENMYKLKQFLTELVLT
jgi:hypothetical protein